MVRKGTASEWGELSPKRQKLKESERVNVFSELANSASVHENWDQRVQSDQNLNFSVCLKDPFWNQTGEFGRDTLLFLEYFKILFLAKDFLVKLANFCRQRGREDEERVKQ